MLEKPKCPDCGSELIVELANQKHCNACGNDFDIIKNAVPRRSGAVGYPARKALCNGSMAPVEKCLIA